MVSAIPHGCKSGLTTDLVLHSNTKIVGRVVVWNISNYQHADYESCNATSFATLVTESKIKPQIAAVKTLWSPETLWDKHETDKIGKIVFSIRS
jgi:hypothetical protein